MIKRTILFYLVFLFMPLFTFGQEADPLGCFLFDYSPKEATIPPYVEAQKPTEDHTVIIFFNMPDTIAKISKYVMGNAVASWTGNTGASSEFVNYTDLLSPSLIRFPGGSWADIFFWNACEKSDIPGAPDKIYDGTTGNKITFDPQFGKDCQGNWRMTTDEYYALRNNIGTQGLITINYGYARYGLSLDPVAQAAHYAANWVRYDNGRTKFWEIGNETAGPWEAGWQIDTQLNQDGQPEIVSGELYGQHFKVFADSMRQAADDVGTEIYIGAQILHYDGTNSWNPVDRTWNEGVFAQVGDAADFYVVHNYFGPDELNVTQILNEGQETPGEMMDFMLGDIEAKDAAFKPIALTEWNIHVASSSNARISSINGMQAVLVFNELIKHGYGMSARWLLANWEGDGMLYKGDNSSIPAYNPRPAFFYVYFLNKFLGNHMIAALSGNSNIVSYASLFSGGELALIVVNKGNTDHTVLINPGIYEYGDHYYIYSLTGTVIGTESPDFPRGVTVNAFGPQGDYWGPIADLETIKAYAYDTEGEIKFFSPSHSVQYVLFESSDSSNVIRHNFTPECKVYPNPSKGYICIDLPPHSKKIEIMNISGNILYTSHITGIQNKIEITLNVPAGFYFIRIHTNKNSKTTKLIIN